MNTQHIPPHQTGSRRTFRGLIAVTAVFALALVGCSAQPSSDTSNDGANATMADQVTVTGAYIKEPSMPEMTGMFGEIVNDGSAEVVLVGGSSDVAGMVEIHEVVEGQMQAIAGGLTVAAGSTAVLEPGGNHIMLMKLSKTLAVGDEVTVTLTFKDGSTLTVTAPVKTVAGGDESYEESGEMSHGDDMSHSGM